MVNQGLPEWKPLHNESFISQNCGRNDSQNVDFSAEDPAKTDEKLAYILLGIYSACGFITEKVC